jgi:hypothetical protein
VTDDRPLLGIHKKWRHDTDVPRNPLGGYRAIEAINHIGLSIAESRAPSDGGPSQGVLYGPQGAYGEMKIQVVYLLWRKVRHLPNCVHPLDMLNWQGPGLQFSKNPLPPSKINQATAGGFLQRLQAAIYLMYRPYAASISAPIVPFFV